MTDEQTGPKEAKAFLRSVMIRKNISYDDLVERDFVQSASTTMSQISETKLHEDASRPSSSSNASK